MLARLFIVLSLGLFSLGVMAAIPTPTCGPEPLATSGGFGNIEYKYIWAKITLGTQTSSAEALAGILAQINITANGGLTQGYPGCSAESHVDTLTTDTKNKTINMRIRIDGSCQDWSDFAKTEEEELTLMASVIQQIVKIPNLDVDPRWSDQPHCVGGGVTGSN